LTCKLTLLAVRQARLHKTVSFLMVTVAALKLASSHRQRPNSTLRRRKVLSAISCCVTYSLRLQNHTVNSNN